MGHSVLAFHVCFFKEKFVDRCFNGYTRVAIFAENAFSDNSGTPCSLIRLDETNTMLPILLLYISK